MCCPNKVFLNYMYLHINFMSVFSTQGWREWRNLLIQYPLMDCLFIYNICDEKHHNLTSSITHRYTQLTIISAHSTWDHHIQKQSTFTHMHWSRTLPTRQTWPFHLHPSPIHAHTQQGCSVQPVSFAVSSQSVTVQGAWTSVTLNYLHVGIVTTCVLNGNQLDRAFFHRCVSSSCFRQ